MFHCFSCHSAQFFLGFLLCSLSCWYSMILKRKRSCVITMKWEAVWRANILRTMSIYVRKLLVTLDNDRSLEWRKKTINWLCTLHQGGESHEKKRTDIEIYSEYLHFENFQLLVKQTSIRLVYLSMIKVTMLNCPWW